MRLSGWCLLLTLLFVLLLLLVVLAFFLIVVLLLGCSSFGLPLGDFLIEIGWLGYDDLHSSTAFAAATIVVVVERFCLEFDICHV